MYSTKCPSLLVEAGYVGNRGAWFYSPLLDVQALRTLGDGQLARYGPDIARQADFNLLNLVISRPQAITVWSTRSTAPARRRVPARSSLV